MERLQKLIAAAGVCSRRAAEERITAGRVKLNGQVVRELGTKASETDRIEVDGVELDIPKRHRYVLLNKPPGYVTTRSDPQRRPTVYDLLFREDEALHPVGRLDQETGGLLLLTNDGELTYRLTHPRYQIEKSYHVWTRPWPKPNRLRDVRRGVELDDGPARPKSASIAAPDCWEVTLTEGRNREVRRLFEALGYDVLLLRRIRLATLELGSLKEGKARPVRPHEVERLRQAAGLAVAPAPPGT